MENQSIGTFGEFVNYCQTLIINHPELIEKPFCIRNKLDINSKQNSITFVNGNDTMYMDLINGLNLN